jgi:hypothetical protein
MPRHPVHASIVRAFAASLLLVFAAAHACAADRRLMMQLAIDRWVQAQAPDGSLAYGFDFLADQPVPPEGRPWTYVVRQVGWMSALAEYYGWSDDARLRAPAVRALNGLRAHSIPLGKARVQDWIESTRILSLPFARWKLTRALDHAGLLYRPDGTGKVVSPDGRYDTALTGAVAVALLAELAYSRASGDESFADLRAAWLEGLTSLRVPGRGFRQSPASIDEDDFSNGEAWLALALYADRFGDDARVAGLLRDLDAVLMDRYARTPTLGFHHWGAMAAAQRWRTTRDPRFLRFLEEQASVFVERLAARLPPGNNNCADVEGAAAALGALDGAGRGNQASAERLRAWVAEQEAIIPRLQLKPGQTRVMLGGDAYLSAPRTAQFAGAFLMGLSYPVTRIDMDMHCVSALVALERNAPSTDK